MTHRLVNVNSSVLPGVRKYGRRTRSSTSNVNKYIIKKCKTTTYQKSFLIRTSRIWNCLADELDLSSSTLASFKSVMFNYYKSALVLSYDCKDPRSFNSICLKCNSARPLSRPITCSFSCIAVFFKNFFFFLFISIRARCNWPRTAVAVSPPTFFLFVCLFFLFCFVLAKLMT